MKLENPARPAISLLLVAVLLSTVFFAPTVAEASTYPERVVKLLLVYDDTYECVMRTNGLTESPEHRLEQMARLAAVPFKQTWNITLDVTVMSYEDAFGTEAYVNSCPVIHPQNEEWCLYGQCTCVPDSQCYTGLNNPGHHNSAYRLINYAGALATSSSVYDAVGIYTGHKLCYYSDEQHKYCAGMATLGGNAFIGTSIYNMISSEPMRSSNLVGTRNLLWHEFSHNYGLPDGTVDFTDPNNCNENYPCILSGGFGGVVYAGNIWCPNCCSRFDYDGFGSLVGGEG